MSRSTFRRIPLVLLLAALLTAPSAFAARLKAPAAPKAAEPVPFQLFSQAWSFFTSLWAEEGCHIDPNGRCLTSTVLTAPPAHSDEGCNLDPNGRCAARPVLPAPPRVDTDSGCHIDPNGRCSS